MSSPIIVDDWQSEWAEGRYNRLLDSLDEYMCDDGPMSGASFLIADLKKALLSTREWPIKQAREIDIALSCINDLP